MRLAARARGKGLSFQQGIKKLLVGDETPQRVQLDMLIVAGVHQVTGEPGGVAALRAFENQGSPPSLKLPSARINSSRMAFTSAQA